VPRRAVLIFAHAEAIDLARRAFPAKASRLLQLPIVDSLPFEVDVHLFTAGRVSASPAHSRLHQQIGRTFAERLENAVEKIHELGYEEIVTIGRDCPSLSARDIERAFAELACRRLVLGPDHRGGCYLIAFRSRDRALLRGVRWQQNTDCAELRRRCHPAEVCLLPLKHDLDSWADLRLFARQGDPLAQLAASLLRFTGGGDHAVLRLFDFAQQRIRIRQQIPPPAFAL
jgi:2-phospho-L-lactate guanylyltransferase (CobY/MobA/RfbA family)